MSVANEIADRLPVVSLLLVVRNEKDAAGRAIASLTQQDYPTDKVEYIFVDGMSTDGTRSVLEEWERKLAEQGARIQLLDNPRRILAAGWNIAIQNATGEVVCRIDAHSELDQKYILTGVNELLKPDNRDVAAVGGVSVNVGIGIWGKAIADLFSSAFGVGNAAHRIGVLQPRTTDTAMYALYWKRIFKEAGLFNENLKRNQDIEMHKRIRALGYRFVTHPDMKAIYYVRGDPMSLAKKAFGDGYWVALGGFYPRHMVPGVFTAYLALVLLNPLAELRFVELPMIAYAAMNLWFSAVDGSSILSKILLPLLYTIFHISYGLGTWKALIDKAIKRILR